MKVSWPVKSSRDLPLPARSIVDGSPHATPVVLNVLGYARLQILRVRVPLTAEQARRLRPYHLLNLVACVYGAVTAVVVLSAVGCGFAGRGDLFLDLLPVVIPVALANTILQGVTLLVAPRAYPRVPIDMFRSGGWSGRIEVRDVDPAAAAEWQRVAGAQVRVTED